MLTPRIGNKNVRIGNIFCSTHVHAAHCPRAAIRTGVKRIPIRANRIPIRGAANTIMLYIRIYIWILPVISQV